MGADQFAMRAFALLALAHNAVASMVEQRHYLLKRDEEPNMQYDFNTIKTCTYWYDNYQGFSCKEIRDWRYGISPEDFTRWNPSVTLDCGNWQELSYCVEVRSEMTSIASSSASTTSITSAAPSSTPTAPALLGWKPLGCYTANRKLKSPSSAFAGLQAGKECWFNDYVGNDWASDQQECNAPCPGDASQMCGGAGVLNFFEAKLDNALPPGPIPGREPTMSTTATSAAATKTSSPVASATPSWQAVGCYGEEHPRILRYGVQVPGSSAENNTRQGCIDTCDRAGYTYAGVQVGAECYCDNVIHEPGKLAPDGAAGCNMACSGNTSETCGGTSREEVFVKSSVFSLADVSKGNSTENSGTLKMPLGSHNTWLVMGPSMVLYFLNIFF
ncbi:WSC-domain-containing protein [Colletotrichum zoysiae]|uniref:WSC-domain-containing protein n=1 Tax=Colletotrichum zoysiae TaxID=1216348 RepID=A0AAD9HH13_9PEZI|nr:WSC-domain-containing protein [Colletotrichum zoysiae]